MYSGINSLSDKFLKVNKMASSTIDELAKIMVNYINARTYGEEIRSIKNQIRLNEDRVLQKNKH